MSDLSFQLPVGKQTRVVSEDFLRRLQGCVLDHRPLTTMDREVLDAVVSSFIRGRAGAVAVDTDRLLVIAKSHNNEDEIMSQFNEPWRLTWSRSSPCNTDELSVVAIPIEGKDYVHHVQFPDAATAKRAMMCVNACAELTDDDDLGDGLIQPPLDLSELSEECLREILMEPARKLLEQDEAFRLQLLAMRAKHIEIDGTTCLT